jgi:alkylation response protein AidB-like acyl-CoA dehydrogenase
MDYRDLLQLLDRADSIKDLAAASAPHAAKVGRLSNDVVEAIRSTGLTGIGLPAALGGFASPPVATSEVLERIAIGDASVAWIVMIASTATFHAALLEPDVAAGMFSEATIVAGVFAPKGTAVAVEGGYRLSGRWPFCSGCLHADWISLGFIDGDRQKSAILPAGAVEVLDTWEVMGLEATGSHDVALHDTFVPADRVVDLSGRPKVDEPLFRFPLFGLLASAVSSVMLGAARGAIDDMTALATKKTPTGSTRSLAERPSFQETLARAEAALAAARSFLHGRLDAAWRSVLDSGDPVDDDARVKMRMAATFAAETATAVVDSMFRAGGGSSIYRSAGLERRFRDVHTAAQHMMVAQPTWEVAGRALLGLGPHAAL